jgi:hypothetical protein
VPRIAAKQRGDVADPLDQRRARPVAQISRSQLRGFAIFGIDPDFDQLVMIQRQQQFRAGPPGSRRDRRQ